MDSPSKAIESAMRCLTTAASIAASAMLARTVVNEFLPSELRNLASSSMNKLFGRFSTERTIIIQHTKGLVSNQLYDAASTYIRTKISPTMKRLKASKDEGTNNIIISLDDGEAFTDIFEGVQYRWKLISKQENSSSRSGYGSVEVRWFELSFHNKHKEITLGSYFDHILEQSKEIKAMDTRPKLHMRLYNSWNYIALHHPAIMDTLAMEDELKQTIVEDLARFVKSKEYYKRTGKAWKRGYLLFGPPGTGKSSLVAAIANYLRFDIYVLDLMEVHHSADLKMLLINIENASILVIEDIDCSTDLRNNDEENKEETNFHHKEVTLSWLLNFIDGLWSTSEEERIIVLTTNYKDGFGPALLRPGRMDMHIHMSYCGPQSFRVLASNYHAIKGHPLFAEIDELLKEVEATPAEVAEQLIRSDDVDIALDGVLLFLRSKRKEGEGVNCDGEGSQGIKQQVLYSRQMDAGRKPAESEIGVSDHEDE